MKDRYYGIIKQKEFHSKYGGTAIEVTMICFNDNSEYKTYIDVRNRNFSNWSRIINHPERGYVISGVKLKNSEKKIINADSDPLIYSELPDIQELYDIIAERLQNAKN